MHDYEDDNGLKWQFDQQLEIFGFCFIVGCLLSVDDLRWAHPFGTFPFVGQM
jgi:hypothetical protein